MKSSTSLKVRVNVLEDNEELREEILFGLSQFGFDVWGCASAPELYRRLVDQRCDIAVVDIGLDGEDGFSVTARLRASGSIGIVILTARALMEDRLRGLQGGADAYLVKPVDLRELAATLQGLARRLTMPAPLQPYEKPMRGWSLEDDDWTLVDPAGSRLSLTEPERIFVGRLMDQVGVVVAREDIAAALAANPFEFDMHRLDMIVNRLRRKAVEAGMLLPLRTVRGKGYVFSTS